MCSHEIVTWNVTDNFVKDRMIDKSLIDKFTSSRKLRRRTKVLNAKIRKYCGVKDYLHYIELKTNVLQNLTEDTDTDDSSSLSDNDYNMIYSSPSKQAKYVAERKTKTYIYSSEEEVAKECQRKIDTKLKEKSRSKNTGKRTRKRKRPISKKYINTDSSDNEGNMLDDRNFKAQFSNQSLSPRNDRNFKAQFSKQSLSPQFDSRNSTASGIMKSGNEYRRQNYRNPYTADTESSSEDNMISNKTKPLSKRKMQNHKNQCGTINKSNAELNSQGSHSQSCDIQKQQLLSSKENRIKDVHSKSYNNILNKANRQKDEEKEEKDLQLNQVDQDTKTYLINQEEKTCMRSEDNMCDIQKQLLPKVICIEILNKKYKIIDKEGMIDAPMASETDNEEDNANYVSPETKKRLQQRARLNLVVCNDSSESSDEEIRKKVEPLTRCTYEKNNSFQTTASPLKETQYCENVYNDDDRSEDIKEDVENFQLRLSESNGSCNNEESINQSFPRDKRSRSLGKENMIGKSNQSENRQSNHANRRSKFNTASGTYGEGGHTDRRGGHVRLWRR